MGVIEIQVGGSADALPEDVDPAADAGQLRVAAGRLGRKLDGRDSFDLTGLDPDRTTAFAEGLVLGGYSFTTGKVPSPTRIRLAGDPAAIERGRDNALATTWVRDLINTPAAVLTPAELGRRAQSLSDYGISVTVRDEQWLTEQGFGGVLAVGRGASARPVLVEASWRPRPAAKDAHVVLVGKGITFDTGGLNLKPGDSMRTMHTDMSGGAAVLGALRLIAQRRLPVRVTALVPAAENAFGADSMRPSDVVRHYGGRTSEIGNTDAEGRIVLADALAYAAARLRPSVLVDAATLTGAMKVALGMRTGGILATDDTLAKQLTAAGERTGEPLWRLPLTEDYADTLTSDVADATNNPGAPGGITAALFLRPFAGGLPWAHLDIAGPARSAKDDGPISKGGTGFGARLLAEWVEALA